MIGIEILEKLENGIILRNFRDEIDIRVNPKSPVYEFKYYNKIDSIWEPFTFCRTSLMEYEWKEYNPEYEQLVNLVGSWQLLKYPSVQTFAEVILKNKDKIISIFES